LVAEKAFAVHLIDADRVPLSPALSPLDTSRGEREDRRQQIELLHRSHLINGKGTRSEGTRPTITMRGKTPNIEGKSPLTPPLSRLGRDVRINAEENGWRGGASADTRGRVCSPGMGSVGHHGIFLSGFCIKFAEGKDVGADGDGFAGAKAGQTDADAAQ